MSGLRDVTWTTWMARHKLGRPIGASTPDIPSNRVVVIVTDPANAATALLLFAPKGLVP